MKAMPFIMLAALALSACDKASAERARDKTESKSQRDSDDEERTPAKTATATATAVAAAPATAKATAEAADDDSPEIADASGAPPAPTVADGDLADVKIPAGVTIPTEEDYEDKAEKEITAANFESELAKIEKDLTP